MREIVRLENVSLTYQSNNGEIAALSAIHFQAWEGEQIAIVGPSGCGKSTLLSIICGLIAPTYGKVFVGGKQINGVSDRIGYMLQKDNLLDWRTIRSNVLLGLEIRGMLNTESTEYVDTLLRTYGLYEFRDKYPAQLSGGMRQRAALIRTLAAKPDLLLLDEAFSALDYQTRLSVTDDVFRILKQENKTALIVTHDIPEGISMSDRIIVLTKRPGSIRNIVPIEFPLNGEDVLAPLDRRNNPAFSGYFKLIWKELENHG